MDKHWGRWLFFKIQTDTHRKLLSLVCSEGPSLWRLGTARQAIWMNVSPWGGLGSRVGTGLEAGVSLTAPLKGGGLRDIHPGLSLSVSLGGNWPCENAGGKSMRVSENSSNFTHPFRCQLLPTSLVMAATPPQNFCHPSLESRAQSAIPRDEAERPKGRDPTLPRSPGHAFFGIARILLVVWNLFCWGPKSVLITIQESNSKIWTLVSAKRWVWPC